MAADGGWMKTWIASVTDGRAMMSQRSVASVERDRGIGRAVEAARARGVHLVKLTDDDCNAIMAGTLASLETLC